MKISKSDIETIEVETSNICNLKCPLCVSQLPEFKDQLVKKFIDVDLFIEKTKEYPNLKTVSIAGDASEPTLHPDLLKLLDYFYNTDINVELFTNASLHDESWWTELNKHLNSKSLVVFTICGTTQELHEKYRVGSSLEKVLKNAHAFKKDNPNKNDQMQYIMFEYNKHEPMSKIMEILNQFSSYRITKTDPIFERLNKDTWLQKDGICSELMYSYRYRQLLKQVLAKPKKDIQCYCYETNFIKIDNLCNVYPCMCYYLYNRAVPFNFDYTDILAGKYECCYECDKQMRKFLEETGRDAFYMC